MLLSPFVSEPIRKCSDCKAVKPLSVFPKNKGKTGGHGYVCKPCCKIRRKEYSSQPENKAKLTARYRSARTRALKRAYENRPEIRAKLRAKSRTPEHKAWRKEYEARPEVQERMRINATKPERLAYMKNWRMKSKLHLAELAHRRKLIAIDILGGAVCSNLKCLVPGGCKDLRALQIDHIYGLQGEKRLKNTQIYTWIIAHPVIAKGTYQVLCANCNNIKKYLSEVEGVKCSPLKALATESDKPKADNSLTNLVA